MLCFLMVDQDLQIIKVTLTIVAPWPRKDLFDVWVVALLLGHVERRAGVDLSEDSKTDRAHYVATKRIGRCIDWEISRQNVALR